MAPTISNIKRLLRHYQLQPWGCIWRDALGLHFQQHYWNAVEVGELKWARWKGLR
jgi:hypothetical protein